MLYRKHRPQSWSSVTAQNHVVKTLTQEIISGTVAHAFLFCGPRGVGKTTTARLLAKSLNCTKRTGAEPCNECKNCQTITVSQSIDVIEIDAASHTGVDNVRENIIENARFTPTQSAYKIFIIDEVHMLSSSAFNALLKTIEEPPAHAIFIMATTELHKIPATILSRCQRFDFKHISHSDIVERLKTIAEKEHVTIDDDVVQHVAWRAHGSMRDAESLLSQVFAVAQNNAVTNDLANTVLPARNSANIIEYLSYALSGNAADALATVATMCETGAHAAHLMDDAIDILRTLLLIKTTQSFGDAYFNTQDRAKLTQVAEATAMPAMLNGIDIFMKRREYIGRTPILHLPLELAAIDCALAAGIQTSVAQNHDASTTASQQKNSQQTPTPIKKKPMTDKTTSEIPITHENKTEIAASSETTETSPHLDNSQPPLTLADINAKWPQFLEHLHEYNHSLPFVLKTCTPTALDGTQLTVTLPYEFHQKKIEEPTVRHNIETALKHIYHVQLSICAHVIANAESDTSNEMVSKVLETFGGKIVSE